MRKKWIYLAFAVLLLIISTAAYTHYIKAPAVSGLNLTHKPDLQISFEQMNDKLEEPIQISPYTELIVSGTMDAGSLRVTITQNETTFSSELNPESFPYLYADISLRSFQDGPARLTVEAAHARNGDLKFQIVTPLTGYDDAMLFSNFQVYAKQGDGSDIYDSQQNFLTKAYATATSSGQNLLYVAKDAHHPDLFCAIDTQGNEVWPSVITAVYSYQLPPALFDLIQIENRIGVLDRTGNLIVPFGDIDIHHSKILPDGNLQIEVGTFGMVGEPLNPLPYPCLNEPGTYLFAPDGTLLSYE